MSGILEEMRKESAIVATIEAGHRFQQSEDNIKKAIMEMFDLDESTADSYLLKKSA
ncbi:MAG: hypothetical protein LUG57_09075 [Oscillospiraceae bacterium]|nr:hypothetical protein [Oscillospiraceae bacterium]